jgi:hypothetical protein
MTAPDSVDPIGAPECGASGILAPDSVDPIGAAECGASAILAPGGPAAVPFELCCVLTMVRANAPDPGPPVCRILAMVERGAALVSEAAP